MGAAEGKTARAVKYRKPITRIATVEGVQLVITLTDKSISARVKRHRRNYSMALSGLFLSVIREAKRRHGEPITQEALDLRVPREA